MAIALKAVISGTLTGPSAGTYTYTIPTTAAGDLLYLDFGATNSNWSTTTVSGAGATWDKYNINGGLGTGHFVAVGYNAIAGQTTVTVSGQPGVNPGYYWALIFTGAAKTNASTVYSTIPNTGSTATSVSVTAGSLLIGSSQDSTNTVSSGSWSTGYTNTGSLGYPTGRTSHIDYILSVPTPSSSVYFGPKANAFAIAIATGSVVNTKTSIVDLVRLSNSLKQSNRVKFALALESSLSSLLKSVNRVKRSVVNSPSLAIAIKSINRVKQSRVVSSSLIVTRKNFNRAKQAIANTTSLVTSSKTFIRVKKAIANQINLAASTKTFKRVKFSIACATIVAVSFKSTRRLKLSRVLSTSLARINKSKKSQVKVVSSYLARVVKSKAFLRKTVVNLTKIVRLNKIRGQNKKVVVLESASATVTRVKGLRRNSSVTISYKIGTTKSRTFFRMAIANLTGSIRYGIARVINIRQTENASTQPVNVTQNYAVTNNNLDLVEDYTNIYDSTPVDYDSPNDQLGEAIIPDPNYGS